MKGRGILNYYDLNIRFSEMFRRSREDAGKSQDYMSKALKVSKKTIQNWEEGISSPSQIRAFEWFEALNLQPLPYYLDALYPGKFDSGKDPNLDRALLDIVSSLPLDMKRKLLYILAGNHGSSTIGFLELACAHLHVPLDRRINIAQSVYTNYELSIYQHSLCCNEDIQPDMITLNRSIELGKLAVMSGKQSYVDDL